MPLLALTLSFVSLTSAAVVAHPGDGDFEFPEHARTPDDTSLGAAQAVLSAQGCAPYLVGKERFPFAEAQATCATVLGMHLVDEILDGKERAPRAALLEKLMEDLNTRGAAPFRKLPDSVLLRGYRVLLLAGMARVDAASPERLREFDDVAAGLVADLNGAAKRGVWLESWPGGRWPCDSALAAAGLVLHGRLRAGVADVDAAASDRAGRALAARLDGLRTSVPTGFPARVDRWTRVTEPEQRGTVIAWTAAFLGVAGLPEGERFARTLVDELCDDSSSGKLPLPPAVQGVAACREWPRGSTRGPDAVSGPIIQGYGTGASALAIPATRVNGLASWARGLDALAVLGGAAGMTSSQRPLERTILLWGSSARPW